jgi:thiazole synthase ThiGH ThiG subunit
MFDLIVALYYLDIRLTKLYAINICAPIYLIVLMKLLLSKGFTILSYAHPDCPTLKSLAELGESAANYCF